MNDCPDAPQIDALFERTVPADAAAALRAHVAACERCLDRFGPQFELELWGATLAAPVSLAPAPLASSFRRALWPTAAALALLIGYAGWRSTSSSGLPPPSAESAAIARPLLLVGEVTFTETHVTSEARIEKTTRFDPAQPALAHVEETRRGADGVSQSCSRVVVLVSTEKP